MKKIRAKIITDYGEYECVFIPDTRGYTVTCPSVEGVVTWGKNLSESKKMVKEAIELCVESKVQENTKRGLASRPVSRKSFVA